MTDGVLGAYNARIEDLRQTEYPMLKGAAPIQHPPPDQLGIDTFLKMKYISTMLVPRSMQSR